MSEAVLASGNTRAGMRLSFPTAPVLAAPHLFCRPSTPHGTAWEYVIGTDSIFSCGSDHLSRALAPNAARAPESLSVVLMLLASAPCARRDGSVFVPLYRQAASPLAARSASEARSAHVALAAPAASTRPQPVAHAHQRITVERFTTNPSAPLRVLARSRRDGRAGGLPLPCRNGGYKCTAATARGRTEPNQPWWAGGLACSGWHGRGELGPPDRRRPASIPA